MPNVARRFRAKRGSHPKRSLRDTGFRATLGMTDMRWLQIVRLRARSLFRRRAVERDLARELQSHLDLQIDDYVARGMTPDDARQAALREFGGIARIPGRRPRHVARVAPRRPPPRPALRLARPRAADHSCSSSPFSPSGSASPSTPPSSRSRTRSFSRRRARATQTGSCTSGSDRGSHVSYDQWRALDASRRARRTRRLSDRERSELAPRRRRGHALANARHRELLRRRSASRSRADARSRPSRHAPSSIREWLS